MQVPHVCADDGGMSGIIVLEMPSIDLPLCPWVKTGDPVQLHCVNAFFDPCFTAPWN